MRRSWANAASLTINTLVVLIVIYELLIRPMMGGR
jgi:hypothetical protein